MPKVWQKLLSTPDELLRDLLVEAVEKDCGIKPELACAEEFLLNQISSDTTRHTTKAIARPFVSATTKRAKTNKKRPRSTPKVTKIIVGFELDGKKYQTKYKVNILCVKF